MNHPEPKNINLGGRYTTTFQQIEWECHCCGADNTTDQDIGCYDDLFDWLLLECTVCGEYYEVEKTILKK